MIAEQIMLDLSMLTSFVLLSSWKEVKGTVKSLCVIHSVDMTDLCVIRADDLASKVVEVWETYIVMQ